MDIKIINGEVVDPAQGENLVWRDIYIRDGIIDKSTGPDFVTINAEDCLIIPAGIDPHTHLLGPLADSASELTSENPEDMRKDAGLNYARMGYAGVIDPGVPPASAVDAWREAKEIPLVDVGMIAMVVSSPPLIKMAEGKNTAGLRRFVEQTINDTGALGIKLVNPGGKFLDRPLEAGAVERKLDGFNITPLELIRRMAEAVAESGAKAPLHLHLNDLGAPWSHEATIKTIEVLKGVRAHIAHAQFHSYGGRSGFSSEAPLVARAVNENPNITIDVGQIVFGNTVTATADETFGPDFGRRGATGSVITELADGACHCARYEYRRQSAVNSVQWACGLELFLLVEDPMRVFLTTDHPNGGPFTAYPNIIAMLMGGDLRRNEFSRLHEDTQNRSTLHTINREYTAYEVASITSAGPAKTLGLLDRGSLTPGAIADMAVYRKSGKSSHMFSSPGVVIKSGRVIARDGEIVKTGVGVRVTG
ncbi:MAG: formylmethanofuran dehydrogenase subunit A [Nitrospinae bacterium]|nr:formylmethanofuran dehydrogenase subunit A [Nitrospinota bacterium]